MVERLKQAIAKARAQRTAQESMPHADLVRPEIRQVTPTARDLDPRPAIWDALERLETDPEHLAAERIVTHQKADPAHVAFDMLRTRLTKMMPDRGWRTIGITSPTKGCGKTTISANLTFSFARHPETYAMVIDLDLRAPQFTRTIGLEEKRDIQRLLDGTIPPEYYMQRVAPRCAVALNSRPVRDSAEVLQNRSTEATLDRITQTYNPDVLIYDLPPLLVGDDALACLSRLDAVILVAAAGQTRPEEIEECEALIADETNLIGVILNKADTGAPGQYYYAYGYGYGSND